MNTTRVLVVGSSATGLASAIARLELAGAKVTVVGSEMTIEGISQEDAIKASRPKIIPRGTIDKELAQIKVATPVVRALHNWQKHYKKTQKWKSRR